MTEDEEELLAAGLNSLHDEGAVHASDLEKLFKFLEKKSNKKLEGLTGTNFLSGMAVITVWFFLSSCTPFSLYFLISLSSIYFCSTLCITLYNPFYRAIPMQL